MSAPKVARAWSVVCGLALILGLIVMVVPPTAKAQADQTQSTCCACHTWEDPVVEQGEWHTVHALQINCCTCHGGNEHALDPTAAHIRITSHPLDNPQLSCQHCHPADYQQRTDGVAVALGLTPSRHEPAARPPASSIMTPWPPINLRGWGWPVELAVAIVVLGLGVMRWRRVHAG